MPLNKPALLFCSCNSVSVSGTLPAPPISSITSSHRRRLSPQHHASSPSSTTPNHSSRRYATINHHSRFNGSPHSPIPEWPKSRYPTPYEILAMNKDAPYTKSRFYQLVKLYHPDKHSHATELDHIPTATRIERYRLIVAANDLLSDPSKRRLYDTHGIGWTGSRPQTINESMRQADRSWRDQPGNASHNATWEDWERWYSARDGKVRDPMYMSNGLFASLVVMMCMVGALAQMNRAGESGAEFMEQRDRSDRAIGQQMARKTMRAAGRSKDERVDEFLRERENVSYQFVPARYDDIPPEQEKS